MKFLLRGKQSSLSSLSGRRNGDTSFNFVKDRSPNLDGTYTLLTDSLTYYIKKGTSGR